MKFLKHKDLYWFIFWFIISFIGGLFLLDKSYNYYYELITFLSIIMGFEITSFSILFNTPLKKVLYNRKINHYETELHRLRTFYSSALLFSILSVSFLLLFNDKWLFSIPYLEIGKHSFVLTIIVCKIYFFYKLVDDLFLIFVYPTND